MRVTFASSEALRNGAPQVVMRNSHVKKGSAENQLLFGVKQDFIVPAHHGACLLSAIKARKTRSECGRGRAGIRL